MKNEISIVDEDGNSVAIFGIERTVDGSVIEFLAEAIPALGFKKYRILNEKDQMKELQFNKNEELQGLNAIENEFYTIKTDSHGITSIFDKQYGLELINSNKGYGNELVLEQDFGDPWATCELSKARKRLGMDGKLTCINNFESYSELLYEGAFTGNETFDNMRDYRVRRLKWRQRVTLYKAIKRVDFKTDIDWDTYDRRVRISFPTNRQDNEGYFSIPYGTLQRQGYDQSSTGWNNANGDWPALEWASTCGSEGINVAVFNKGTPSCRIERGEIFVSVLRSPTTPAGLSWTEFYDAPVYNGMRDHGEHTFLYALYSFYGEWNKSDVSKAASLYNKPFAAFRGAVKAAYEEMSGNIGINAEGVCISAIKKAESDNGIIVRMHEYKGIQETVFLKLPDSCKQAIEVNFLEKEQHTLEILDGGVFLNIGPYKIISVHVKM